MTKTKKNTHSIFLPCTHTYTHVKGTQPKKWAEIRMLRHLCRLDGSSQWVQKYSGREFSKFKFSKVAKGRFIYDVPCF